MNYDAPILSALTALGLVSLTALVIVAFIKHAVRKPIILQTLAVVAAVALISVVVDRVLNTEASYGDSFLLYYLANSVAPAVGFAVGVFRFSSLRQSLRLSFAFLAASAVITTVWLLSLPQPVPYEDLSLAAARTAYHRATGSDVFDPFMLFCAVSGFFVFRQFGAELHKMLFRAERRREQRVALREIDRFLARSGAEAAA